MDGRPESACDMDGMKLAMHSDFLVLNSISSDDTSCVWISLELYILSAWLEGWAQLLVGWKTR